MRKILLVLTLFICCVGFSQNYQCTITGVISDSTTQLPIPFATIKYSAEKGVVTDINGEFSLTLSPGSYKLEVSAIGYKSQVKILTIQKNNSSRTINFLLEVNQVAFDDFVVSANKYERKIADETVSTTVVNTELINEKATTNVKTIVDQVPGVHLQEGQVSIRGGAGFSYGAGSRVLLMVDGIPMLSGDAGDIKWNYLPVENINQIEILKGASSVLYGSSALNGVINIRTKYPTSKPETSINLIAGMYDNPYQGRDLKWWNGYRGTQGVNFYHSRQVTKNFDLVVGGNFFNDQSFRMEESEIRGRLNVNTRFLSKKKEGLFYGINLNGQLTDVDLFFAWKHQDSVLTPSEGTNSTSKNNRFNVDPYIEYFTKKGDKHALKTRWFNTDNNNQLDKSQSSSSNLLFADYSYRKKIDSTATLTSGATFIKTFVNSTLYGNHESRNIAVYSQIDKVFFKRLTLSAGLRAESFLLDEDKEKIRPIFRTGINYNVAKATFVRASYGQGYRFTSIAEKYASTNLGALKVFPNPNLLSESGWSAELGIKQGIKVSNWKGFLDMSAFVNEYDNMNEYTFGFFDTVTFEQKTTGSVAEFGASSRNVDKARISGIDFSLVGKGNVGKIEVIVLAGYTYMNPKPLNPDTNYLGTFSSLTTNFEYDKNLDLNSDTVSQNLKYRFNHLLKLDVQIGYNDFSFGISYRYNSFVHNIDESFNVLGLFTNQTFLGDLEKYRRTNRKGNTIFDLRIGYQFSKTIKVNATVNNFNATSSNIMLDFTFTNASSQAKGWLDYVEIVAQRQLRLQGDWTSFRNFASTQAATAKYSVANSNGNTEIWNITTPTAIQKMNTSGTNSLVFSDNSTALQEYVAVNTNGSNFWF